MKNLTSLSFLSPINTAQWLESLPYPSITLKTLKNETGKDEFQRKWILCYTVHYGCRKEEKNLSNKKMLFK